MKSQTGKEVSRKTNTPPPSARPAPAEAPAPPPPRPLMKPPFWTIPVTGLLFVAWLGYLIFLVATLPHAPGGGPVVLSRPQFLVSPLDVVAQVDAVDAPVVIKEVLYPKGPEVERLVGQTVVVTNLGQCRPGSGAPPDFTMPGQYILALRPTDNLTTLAASLPALAVNPTGLGLLQVLAQPVPEVGSALSYEVVPTPPSPGYPNYLSQEPGPPRIYPDIEANRAQLRQIPKPPG